MQGGSIAPRNEGGEGLVLLDACCLINLFATGRAEEILESLPYGFAVARYVAEDEVVEVGAEGEERVSLHPLMRALIDKKILKQLAVSSSEESRHLVRFAVDLDDGEAHTCALAFIRNARVATDDKKAIRVLSKTWRERDPSSDHRDPFIRTSKLLFEWADAEGIEEAELAQIVRAVGRKASFIPPRNDPHFDRWMKLLRS
jgi:predicted nucleic acid-binding protein